MKINKLTKRIVSFITALSLSISSTVMVLPASAFADNSQESGYTDVVENSIEERFGDGEDETQTITVTASSNGHGDVNTPSDNPEAGTQVDFYLYPEMGYKIGNIAVTYGDNQTVQYYESDDGYYFTAPSENVTITATFVACDVTFNYKIVDEDGNADETGNAFTVSKIDGTVLKNGDTFTVEDLPLSVSFSPVRGYKSGSLYIYENESGGDCFYGENLAGATSLTLDNNDLPILNDDCERFFVAEFGISDEQYNVNLNIENGTADVESSSRYKEPVYIWCIDPANGYELDTITATYTDSDSVPHSIDIQSDGDTPYFIMPAYDVDVTVTFKVKSYTVDLEPSDVAEYKVTTKGGKELFDEDTITVNDFPLTLSVVSIDDNCLFSKWAYDNGSEGSSTEQTATIDGMQNWDNCDNLYISIVCNSKPFTVTADPDAIFTISGANGCDLSECYSGDYVYFTISVPDGYYVRDVRYNLSNGTSAPVVQEEGHEHYVITGMPAADVTITADVYQLHDVTVNATNGKVTPYVIYTKSFTDVVPGDAVYFQLIPDDDYYWISTLNFADIKTATDSTPISYDKRIVDGTECYYFTMPDDDVTITVTFPEKTKWEKNGDTYSITQPDVVGVGVLADLVIPVSDLIEEGKDINEIDSVVFTHTPNGSFKFLVDNVADTATNSDGSGETVLQLSDKGITADNVIRIINTSFIGTYETFTISKIEVTYKKYDVNTAYDSNGTITASVLEALKGNGITFTVKPIVGYKVKNVYCTTDSGSPVTVTEGNNGYEFVMPGEAVTIYAEYEQCALTVTDGTDTYGYDTWAEIAALCNGDFKGKDVTLTINKDITLKSDEALPAAVNSLKIEGSGKLVLANSVKTLNIPVDTTLNVTVKSKNKLDITVAADTKLTFETSFNSTAGINKLSGNSSSELVVFRYLVINELSTFDKVNGPASVCVNGAVTSINKFGGDIRLADTAEIGFAEEGSYIYLIYKEDGSVPKLTLTDCEDITVYVADSFDGEASSNIASGTTVLYTNGKDLSGKITINIWKDGYEDSFPAVFYSDTNEIKAELANAVKVSWDEDNMCRYYSTLEKAMAFIDDPKDDDGNSISITDDEFEIYLNGVVVATPSFAFPTNNKNIKKIIFNGEDITFTGEKLEIPYDVTFNKPFKVKNEDNLIDITVDAGATLYFADATGNNDEKYPYINNLTGKSGSTVDGDFDAVNISGFGKVAGYVDLYGNMSDIGSFYGDLCVHGENSTVDISDIIKNEYDDEGITCFYLYRNSDDEIPKVTIGSISDDASIAVDVSDSEDNYSLESGETILYTKDSSFAKNGDMISKISIDNGSRFKAFYYTKNNEIKAEYADVALTKRVASNGNDNDWEEIQSFPSLELACEYINNNTEDKSSEYVFTILNGAEITASADFAFPTKNPNVKSIVLAEGSYPLDAPKIIFTGTKLDIPYNVTFDILVEVSNKNNLIDITVADGAKLAFNKVVGYDGRNSNSLPCINKITGKGSAELACKYMVAVNDVSGFSKVDGSIKLFGNMSKIGNFIGNLYVRGEKSTVDITNISGESEIYLNENSKGTLPKVTIESISKLNKEDKEEPEAKLTVYACDNSGDVIDLKGGETLLYTKDNKFADNESVVENIIIDNGSVYIGSSGDWVYPFSAYYYSKTKSITAECTTAITLNKRVEDAAESKWEKIKDFRSLDAVVDYINKQTDGVSEYQIFLNQDIEASAKFAFPTKNKNVKSIEINGGTDRTITFTGTKLAIPYNVTFEAAIKASNKTNLIDITVENGAELVFNVDNCRYNYGDNTINNQFKPYINKLTGKGTSKLSGDYNIFANDVSGFGNISGTVYIYGTMSKIGNFTGSLYVYGEKSTVDITNVSGNSVIGILRNSNGVLPKVTIASIKKLDENDKVNAQAKVVVLDNKGSMPDIAGETILYTKDNKFAEDGVLENVIIQNNNKELSAFYYSKTKSIKAEYANAIGLCKRIENGWDNFKNFPNLDAVVDYINKTEETDSEYRIWLNENVTASANFAFPTKNKNVKGIEIYDPIDERSITFTGTKLAIPYNVTIDADIKVSNKTNLIDITVANNATLTIDGDNKSSDTDCPYINKLTGQSGSKLLGDVTIWAYDVSGFGTIETDIELYGNMSKISDFNGYLYVRGEKSTVDITNVSGTSSCFYLYENSKGILPKVTIASVSKKDGDTKDAKLYVQLLRYDGLELILSGGETVLYTKDNKFANDGKLSNVAILNNDDQFSAFYYSKTKSIKAEYAEAITLKVKDGENGEDGEVSWKSVKSFQNLDAVVDYINGNTSDTTSEYEILLNREITAPASFAFPTKNKNVKSITVGGSSITFTGTKLNIPYDVTFEAAIKASNKTNLIDVTVAKNATLAINELTGYDNNITFIPYINKITGTKDSKLVLDELSIVNNIASFGTVECDAIVKGTITGVTNLSGSLVLSGEKSSAVIENILNNAKIVLCKNSKGEIPKLTVTKIDGKMNIGVCNNEFEIFSGYSRIESGVTLFYTKDNKFAKDGQLENVTVENNNNQLSAFYYSKTKSIKAEYADAITLNKKDGDSWTKIQDFQNLDKVVDFINGNTSDTASEYQIYLNKSVTASSTFAFPTKNKNVKGIEIACLEKDNYEDQATITFTGTKLAIPYNVTIEPEILVSNKNNTMDITVAKGVDFSIGSCLGTYVGGVKKPYINKLTGQGNSTLTVRDIDVTSISGFGKVSGIFRVYGSISKITDFSGSITLSGEKTTADITNISGKSYIGVYENSKGELPKVTIGSISKNAGDKEEATLWFAAEEYDSYGDYIDLASGRTILYTKDNKFADADKISIYNNRYDEYDESTGQWEEYYPLSASFDSKTKTIKAVNENAVELYSKKSNKSSWGKMIDCYSSFEEAVDYINKNGNENTDYRIYVAETVECSKFALPNAKKVHKLYVETYFWHSDDYRDWEESAIIIGKTSTITANYDVDMNAVLSYTSKALTLSAKGNVDIGNNSTFDKYTGTAKNTLHYYEDNGTPVDISGFGTVKVDEDCSFNINTTFSTNKLVLGENAGIIIDENMKSGSFSELKAGYDAYIYYVSASCKPLTYKGKAENFKVKDKLYFMGQIGHGSKLLSTKALENPSKYLALGDIEGFDVEPDFKQVGNDICLYGKSFFGLDWDSRDEATPYFDEWSDVISYINKANDPDENYSIFLYGNYNANGALTLPKKGTYKTLYLMGGYDISFTGSLKLTGNTGFYGVTLKNSAANASYTIDGSGYDLMFYGANAPMAAITAKNVSISASGYGGETSFTASQIKVTEKLIIDGSGKFCNLYVPNGIEAKNFEYANSLFTLYLESGKKINVTGEMVNKTADGFGFSVVDKNGDVLTTFSKNYSLGTIKKGADSLYLENSGYKLEINKTTGAITVVAK